MQPPNPTANEPTLTKEQLKYLQHKLRQAWFKVLDAENIAQQYIPPGVWSYHAHAAYFEEEETRIYECLQLVNRQVTSLINHTTEVTN